MHIWYNADIDFKKYNTICNIYINEGLILLFKVYVTCITCFLSCILSSHFLIWCKNYLYLLSLLSLRTYVDKTSSLELIDFSDDLIWVLVRLHDVYLFLKKCFIKSKMKQRWISQRGHNRQLHAYLLNMIYSIMKTCVLFIFILHKCTFVIYQNCLKLPGKLEFSWYPKQETKRAWYWY